MISIPYMLYLQVLAVALAKALQLNMPSMDLIWL